MSGRLFNNYVSYRNADLFQQLPLAFDDNKLKDLRMLQLVKGYQQLHQTDFLLLALDQDKDVHRMAVDLFDAVFKVRPI